MSQAVAAQRYTRSRYDEANHLFLFNSGNGEFEQAHVRVPVPDPSARPPGDGHHQRPHDALSAQYT